MCCSRCHWSKEISVIINVKKRKNPVIFHLKEGYLEEKELFRNLSARLRIVLGQHSIKPNLTLDPAWFQLPQEPIVSDMHVGPANCFKQHHWAWRCIRKLSLSSSHVKFQLLNQKKCFKADSQRTEKTTYLQPHSGKRRRKNSQREGINNIQKDETRLADPIVTIWNQWSPYISMQVHLLWDTVYQWLSNS